MRILLIEDDAVLRDVMLRSLHDAGHRVDLATNVEDADHLWCVQRFDAVLLDLNLPATSSPTSGLASGLQALRQARGRGDRTPVLVLTARDRTDERIAGLDAGADDYLGKPFDLAEVEARLRALVRRAQGTEDIALLGKLRLDRRARRFAVGGDAVLRRLTGDRQIHYRFVGQDGAQAAVGFEIDVDGLVAQNDDYHQETGVHKSSETHGGGDVRLYATGAGSASFKGTIENIRVFDLMKAAAGL